MEESHPRLHRCVSMENNETGRSFLAKSNHRIYRKELLSDWKQSGEAMPTLDKGSFVAMKQFCGRTCKKEMKDICRKEFDMLVKCSHENVVTVLDICLEVDDANPESWPYFLMELGECSLQFALTTKQINSNEFAYPTGDCGYTWIHCISWLRQIANAIDHLHRNSIVHRDLKTANVLLFDRKTICKVCDFDTSRFCDPEGMTVDIGTWRWMAPEVRSRSSVPMKQRYDAKADCYSFGILICETIFRQRPFDCYEDRDMRNLEIPSTPLMEEPGEELGAMAMERDNESKTMRVVLNRTCAVFPNLSDKMWQLIEELLAWKPSRRSPMSLVLSRLAIEPPQQDAQNSSDRPPPLADIRVENQATELSLKTDTGLRVNFVCPSIPSVSHNITLQYSIQLPDSDRLSMEEKDRIVEVLKTHSDDVASFLEDEVETAGEVADRRQALDGVPLPDDALVADCPASHFRFTDSDRLEHGISGSDHATRRRVANICSASGGKFSTWLADLFSRESKHRRLRGIRFQAVNGC